jgi:hypothetical protein
MAEAPLPAGANCGSWRALCSLIGSVGARPTADSALYRDFDSVRRCGDRSGPGQPHSPAIFQSKRAYDQCQLSQSLHWRTAARVEAGLRCQGWPAPCGSSLRPAPSTRCGSIAASSKASSDATGHRRAEPARVRRLLLIAPDLRPGQRSSRQTGATSIPRRHAASSNRSRRRRWAVAEDMVASRSCGPRCGPGSRY